MSPEPTQYRTVARLLHWGMAILVLAMIAAGLLMVRDGLDRSLQNALFIFHKNTGVALLVLALVRLAYRWRRPPPPLPAHVPRWQALAAGASHATLYTLMIAMPIAGYTRVKAGGFPIETLDAAGLPALVPRSEALAGTAKLIHGYGGYVITAVIAVHVLAALFHRLIRRDGVFSRIWPPIAPGTR